MKQWKQLYSTNGYFVCPYCLRTLPISDATKDHKNPIGRFKDKNKSNIQPTCKRCNNQKGMLTDAEYKLWLLLNDVRNGKKDKELLKNLEYIMFLLSKQHYRGF